MTARPFAQNRRSGSATPSDERSHRQRSAIVAKAIAEFSKKRFAYDWKTWMNGKVYRAVQGEDFDCSPQGFVNTLYSRAASAGMSLATSIDGKAVEFQFKK